VKSTANLFFAVAIHGGGVNQIDTQFDSGPEHAIQSFVGNIRESDIGATKTQGTDVQPGLAKRPEFDGSQRGRLCGATWDHGIPPANQISELMT
jgi:hypothetical protein